MKFIGCLLTLAFLGVAGFVLFQMYEEGKLRPEKLRSWLDQPATTAPAGTVGSDPGQVPAPSKLCSIVVAYIKENLGDTSGFEIVKEWEPVEQSDFTILRLKYRAKNPFGGMSVLDKAFFVRNGKVKEDMNWSQWEEWGKFGLPGTQQDYLQRISNR